MLNICRRCGINAKDWLNHQLKNYFNNFEINYEKISNDYYIFSVIIENKKHLIVLNDFEIKAKFLGENAELLNYKWINKISNNCKQLKIDYKNEYKQYLLNLYSQKLKEQLKNFDNNLYIANKLEEKTM